MSGFNSGKTKDHKPYYADNREQHERRWNHEACAGNLADEEEDNERIEDAGLDQNDQSQDADARNNGSFFHFDLF